VPNPHLREKVGEKLSEAGEVLLLLGEDVLEKDAVGGVHVSHLEVGIDLQDLDTLPDSALRDVLTPDHQQPEHQLQQVLMQEN
jgi:hypothetical protein